MTAFDNPSDKPRKCRLSDDAWLKYCEAAQPGRLFFSRGYSLLSRINQFYQSIVMQRKGENWNHCGVIGPNRSIFESLFPHGPRVSNLDNYTVGRIDLMIMIPVWADAPMTTDEAQYGLVALDRYMRSPRPHVAYDWLSLLTFGWAQKNRSVICSELDQMFLDEAWRGRPTWPLGLDILRLPDDLTLLGVEAWKG